MADSNDIEVAPIGTKALLEEVAKSLREDEKRHKARLDEVSAPGAGGVGEVGARFKQETIARVTERLSRTQRLVGKVDALLAGWEAE